MSIDWTRREPQTLRPFFGASVAATLLDHAAIILRPGGDPNSSPRIIELGGLEDVDPSLLPKLEEEDIERALGDKRNAFELVVTLRTPSMFRRELVSRHELNVENLEEIKIDPAFLKDARLSKSFEISLSICLIADSDLGPGWPSHFGSRIAQKVFTVGLDRSQSVFEIKPLTEDLRKSLSLPAGAFVWVDNVNDLNQTYDDTSCATAYVAETLLNNQKRGHQGEAINAMILSEIVYSLLTNEEGGVRNASELVSDSPLDNLLTNLGGGKKLELRDIQRLTKDPAKLRARIHHASKIVAHLEKL